MVGRNLLGQIALRSAFAPANLTIVHVKFAVQPIIYSEMEAMIKEAF